MDNAGTPATSSSSGDWLPSPPIDVAPPGSQGLPSIGDSQMNALAAAAAQLAASGADTSTLMFFGLSIQADTMSLLNDSLKIVSQCLLAPDLAVDRQFASQMSGLKLISNIPAGTSAGAVAARAAISAKNQNTLLKQQVLQAELKTHQNQEQLDIQNAATISSNTQQWGAGFGDGVQTLTQIIPILTAMRA